MAIAIGTEHDDPCAAVDRDGSALLPGALSRAEVDRLAAATDAVWRSHRSEEPALGAEPLHLLAFVGLDGAFLELLDHPATLPVVTGLLGSNIFMYHCHLDVHPPERSEPDPATRWMWHQDGGRQNVDLETDPRPRMSVKVAFFLTDCDTPERGTLRVIPGSHRRNTLARPSEGGPEDPHGATPILARAGDAVVFDRRLWHMRGRNLGDRTRRVLFLAYTYRWIRPRDDVTVLPEHLGALTPVRAQLLGAGTGAIGHWIPDAADAPLGARAAGGSPPLR